MSKVILRVEKNLICPLNPASVGPASPDKAGPDNPNATGFLEVLSVDLDRLKAYASNSGWILDIAEVLFGLNPEATLWKLDKNENIDAWANKKFDPPTNGTKWTRIKKETPMPLESGIYEYRHWDIILLRYYSAPTAVTWPQGGTTGNVPNFAANVNKRDNNKCVVTKFSRLANTCTASHLIPERLGHSGNVRIMERFGKQVGWQNAHLDTRAGVLLYRGLDELVDKFKLAFYTPDLTKPTKHVMHNFSTTNPNEASVIGISVQDLQGLGMQNVKSLHNYPCVVSSNKVSGEQGGMVIETTYEAPPLEVFRWHYAQCVLQWFGTQQYRD